MVLQVLFKWEVFGMELNDTQKKAVEVIKKISDIMGNRISTTKIYD